MPERGWDGTASRVWGWLRRRPAVAALARLHRDQEGGLLEYAMVFTAIVVPLLFLFDRLFDVLSDYFSMIAFFASWPFL
jgi:hypothetical protein